MKLENVVSKTAERARSQAEDAIVGAQAKVEKAGDWVVGRKTPVRKVTSIGLKLSAISHETTDKLLKQQSKAIEGEFDAIGRYLKSAANTNNVRAFVREQAAVLPRLTRRAIDNSRQSFDILRDATVDVSKLVRGTVTELRKTPAATKTRKTAKKVAKVAKKARAKAKPAVKKTARRSKTKARKAA